MKKLFNILIISAIIAAGVVGVKLQNEKTVKPSNYSSLVLANLNALLDTETETGTGPGLSIGEDGEQPGGNGGSSNENGESSLDNGKSEFTREKCLRDGGNWNMASVCQEGGVTDIVCTVSGELHFLGIVIKGSYQKGKKYPMTWARYACVQSLENCCTKQGVLINEHTPTSK